MNRSRRTVAAIAAIALTVAACNGDGGDDSAFVKYERVWPDGFTETTEIFDDGRVIMRDRHPLERLAMSRTMGADARIGSIEAGKDADLLILDGDPLHYKTFTEIAIVSGKIVYEKAKEPFYSHIRR